jgi:hypothetical protein
MGLAEFLAARIDEDAAHARKDLWAASRATAGGRWAAVYGYNLPHSYLAAEDAPPGVYIAEFASHRFSPPLADGEDDLHAADVLLAARMASGARLRAARVLRDVTAKRAMLADLDLTYRDEEHLMRLLAAVYSDHPDYNSEWK